jgi:hypothetical protein
MAEKWIEIFDAAKSGGRATISDVREMAESYDPNYSAAPATIGHTDDYDRKPNSKIPVGAWVEKVKQDGSKLFASFKFPDEITVAIPDEFKELAGMPAFFKQAVNNKLYSKRSVGISNKDGKKYLHHVAYLGGQLPQCKGMADQTFTEELSGLVCTFSDQNFTEISEQPMSIKVTGFKKAVQAMNKTLTRADVIAFAEAIDPADPNAEKEVDQLLEAIREMYGLPEDADVGQCLGALKAEQAEVVAASAGAAAVAAALTAPVGGMPLSMYTELTKQIQAVSTKVDKFAEATPATPTVPATPAAPAADAKPNDVKDTGTIDALPLTPDQVTSEVNDAVTTLKGLNVWIPAWDEGADGNKFTDVLAQAAVVPFGDGSLLDGITTALSSLPNIAQMSEVADQFILTDNYNESKKSKKSNTVSIATGNRPLGSVSEDAAIEAYAEKNSVSYSEAFRVLAQA